MIRFFTKLIFTIAQVMLDIGPFITYSKMVELKWTQKEKPSWLHCGLGIFGTLRVVG